MSAHKQENVGATGSRGQASKSDANDKSQSARKRTKTGCLTCRKRRIKCDEGKPVCKNCQKSKRQCEGYNTRVVFKPADFTYLPHGAATITFDAGYVDGHGENIHHSAFPQQSGPTQRSMSTASSQPPYQYNGFGDPRNHGQSPPLSTPHLESPVHGMQSQAGFFYSPADMTSTPFTESHPPFPHLSPTDHMSANSSPFQPIPGQENSSFQEPLGNTSWQSFEQTQYNPVMWSSSYVANGPMPTEMTQPWQRGAPDEISAQSTPSHQDQANHAYVSNGQGTPSMNQRSKYENGNGRMPSNMHLQAELGSTGILDEAAIELHDEDYYDVDSEDEMYDMGTGLDAQTLHYQEVPYGHSTMEMNQLSAAKLDTRYFDSFVFNGALDTYRPEHVANPLKNAATARVFAHFISETAVILTTSPRQIWRMNPAASNKANQLIRNDIWTSSLAMAALHHQGLLQSMLAISSLQIAKIQGASETPSLKHYAYALKRIHSCVGNPQKRLSVPVLAASLLLGYYEVMAANHANWQSHVRGARHLVVETDFAGMTKMFRQLKLEKASQSANLPRHPSTGLPRLNLNQPPHDLLLDQMLDTDESTVSMICGIGVNYGSYGHVGEANALPNSSDLEKYDMLRDLYWWYCKQDVWHSLISSDPLMMDYSRYTDCPPRAPLGRPDAPYGSLDHLILLLARIAEFAVKDRKRKLRVERANIGSPQQADGRRASNVSYGRRQSDSPHMPFSQRQSHSPASTTSHSYDSMDLSIATANALQEWNSIRQALEFFTSSLGPYFQPLDIEGLPAANTPFGPALVYRTWDLSVFWTVYHMAMMAALRNHPNMPPAAHVAAAAAAEQTKPHALAVGRVAAGIVTPPESQPLDPKMGAAMIDMIIPQFFAGIQFMETEHRNWLVERLFETTRRTGWATASIIAEGCQSGWIRAAEAGRGPPHVRVRKATFSDFRIGRYASNEVANNQGRVSELDAENDRKFVRTKASARVHWAIGLMGTEEDVPDDSDEQDT